MEDAISITLYIRIKAEDVRGICDEEEMRLEDATAATNVASSIRIGRDRNPGTSSLRSDVPGY